MWSYDATKKEYYFGYEMLLVVDVNTQLPIAAQFVQWKQASKEEWSMVIQEGILVKKPTILLGDSGLDIIEMQELLMDEHVLPIISLKIFQIIYQGDNIFQVLDSQSHHLENAKRVLSNILFRISTIEVPSCSMKTLLSYDE